MKFIPGSSLSEANFGVAVATIVNRDGHEVGFSIIDNNNNILAWTVYDIKDAIRWLEGVLEEANDALEELNERPN
jgi:hypothetical protein